MKHIVSFSGGAGSFATAKRIVDKYGIDNVVLAFCDTMIEDEDLYRFLLDTAKHLTTKAVTEELEWLCLNVPPVYEDYRASHLIALSIVWNKVFGESFVYLQDGRDIWEVFQKNRWVGNSRVAHCTVDLKGKIFGRWLTQAYQPEDCVLHFGFDWAESHRLETAKKNWSPYACEAVLCDPPYLNRQQILQVIDDCEIDLPRLYEMGFSHNNCGGFCVKAGLKHFKKLREVLPKVYDYHSEKYEEIALLLPTAKPFLKKTVNKVQSYLTLKEYGAMLDSETPIEDIVEESQCGCFSGYNPQDDADSVFARFK